MIGRTGGRLYNPYNKMSKNFDYDPCRQSGPAMEALMAEEEQEKAAAGAAKAGKGKGKYEAAYEAADALLYGKPGPCPICIPLL